MSEATSLLAVSNLSVEFRTRSGTVRALERVGFEVARGETVAIVGESGSGKSVTAYALLGLLDPAARVISGSILFGGLELLRAGERALEEMRGREFSLISQNPRGALNPIRPIGKQLEDVLVRHGSVTRAQAPSRAVEMLAKVGIPDPERRAGAYPFELSGGMCQRVTIALALACSPALLIADEPTTGLDVTTQAVVMDLLAELAAASLMATILITHDLGLAGEYADRIVVMHAGHVVESAPVPELFSHPRHPYTAKLIAATPKPDMQLADLTAIPGNLPDVRRADLPNCRYSARCARHQAKCEAPLPSISVGPSHLVACWQPL
ncbi:MAG: ABC transporter ATP-binding protein [Stellaceae bacterium]